MECFKEFGLCVYEQHCLPTKVFWQWILLFMLFLWDHCSGLNLDNDLQQEASGGLETRYDAST